VVGVFLKTDLRAHIAVILFCQLLAFNVWSASPLPKKYWGHYKGLSLECILKLEPLEKCRTELTVDKTGLIIGRYVNKYFFQVRYSRDWILPEAAAIERGFISSDDMHTYGLGMRPNSTDVQLWFTFIEDPRGAIKVYSTLGRVTATIDLSFYFENNDKTGANLRNEIEKLRNVMGPNVKPRPTYDDTHFRRRIDIHKAIQALRTGTREEKRSAITDVAENIIFESHEMIDLRILILEMGLTDVDPLVQETALWAISSYANIRDSIPMLTSVINTAIRKRREYLPIILSQTVESIITLLFESFDYLQITTPLLKNFSTIDIGAIFERTGGQITGEQLREIEVVDSTHHSRVWTANDYSELLLALAIVVHNPTVFSAEDIAKAQRAIKTYADPFGPCVGLLTH
jgi:hypothetical protein